jgi:hypothetical protein
LPSGTFITYLVDILKNADRGTAYFNFESSKVLTLSRGNKIVAKQVIPLVFLLTTEDYGKTPLTRFMIEDDIQSRLLFSVCHI